MTTPLLAIKPITLASTLILILLSACSKPEPPATVVEVAVQPVQMVAFKPTMSFVGRLQAENDVQIEAQVTGYLEDWDYQEGDIVEQGQVLYQIDPAQFEADLAQTQAALAGAQAAAKVATRNEQRGRELIDKGAISAAEMDRLEATKLEADAALQAAEAEVTAAEVNLAFATIRAPITGRIGRSTASPGDLVGPNTGVLTTLVSLDPMQVVFQASETAFLQANARMQELEQQGQQPPTPSVQLTLANDDIYPQRGEVDYISNRIDQATGTIEARATVPNPNGTLRPGQYVQVLLEIPVEVDTLMLPQVALQSDQQGDYVLVVGADNKVVRRNVTVGERVDDNIVVSDGVTAGEQIIVKGLQKVRPGQTVKTTNTSATPR